MQAIWSGAISFGLISIPVRMFGATEERSVRFNQLHETDHGRVRYNRTCQACGKENLTVDDMVKGYEYEKGRYVEITEADLDAVAVESMRTIEVVSFVPAEQIDPIYYARTYYLSPEDVGLKAYALLRQALESSDRVAIAKVTLRDKERLATLRVRGRVIVLETMYWPDEIRDPAFPQLDVDLPVREQELRMAETLIESLTEEFDPSLFEDEYRKALLKLIEAKIAGEEIVAPPAPEPEEGPAPDLMKALEASLRMVKRRRKPDAEAEE